ncbi:MAG: hypothetical protein K2O59_13030 [Lachnospiraceae bacterium]|nr:hypothetical protein [Lachnospiraceae bacterium]
MADKIKERECFEKVLNCKTVKGQFARDIRSALLQKKEYIDYSCERPDIIIQDDSEVIGIEHCQVDVLFRKKKKKAQSMVGKQNNQIKGLIEKYKDEELLEKDISNGTALTSVLKLVEERVDYRNLFKYSDFIENFKRVCGEHNNNCKIYRKKLNAIAAGKNISLACLVEIPYSKETVYRITDANGTRNQAIHGLPMTIDMLLAIQSMNGFDFVILCMYCLNDPKKEKDIICYFFSPRAVVLGINQQNIKPVYSFELLNSFGLPFKTDVRFPEDKFKIDNGNITFKAVVTKK